MPRSGSGAACPQAGEELAAVWGEVLWAEELLQISLGAARVVHDLSASCKVGRGFAEPQFPGVTSVGPLTYPTLHFFTVLCLPQEDRVCFVMLL